MIIIDIIANIFIAGCGLLMIGIGMCLIQIAIMVAIDGWRRRAIKQR